MKEISCTNQNPGQGEDTLLKTRIFELYKEKYKNLNELSQAMNIPVRQLYGVYQGKYRIDRRFIIGAIRAFPEYNIGNLFYFTS